MQGHVSPPLERVLLIQAERTSRWGTLEAGCLLSEVSVFPAPADAWFYPYVGPGSGRCLSAGGRSPHHSNPAKGGKLISLHS